MIRRRLRNGAGGPQCEIGLCQLLASDGRDCWPTGSAIGRLFALVCDLEMGAGRTSDPSRRAGLDNSSVVRPRAEACRPSAKLVEDRRIGWIGPVLARHCGGRADATAGGIPSFDIAIWTGASQHRIGRCSRSNLISSTCARALPLPEPISGDVGGLEGELRRWSTATRAAIRSAIPDWNRPMTNAELQEWLHGRFRGAVMILDPAK